MGFLRTFNDENIKKMTGGKNAELFKLLKTDVLKGDVFPAVRINELHFYYKGGRLYRFAGGSFKRDKNYARYGETGELTPYESAKKQNENKFTNTEGAVKERRLLDRLYCHTFGEGLKSEVVVLDVEVDLNGFTGRGKKCDLVLLNTRTDELMFVEGKVFSDRRVNRAVGFTPEVIGQVDLYTAAIAEQRREILGQYAEHIRIVNSLFGAEYMPPKALIEPAKLLVYETGGGRAENTDYTIDIINRKLGKGNVMWVERGAAPTTDEIWAALTEGDKCR